MKSNLEKSLLLESLERLGSGSKTGVLHLSGPSSREIKIYISNGAVIHISGTIKEARLEHLLIGKKLFSTERVQDLLRIAKKENQPLLRVLLNKKLATLASLEKLMAFHARYIIVHALAWSGGTFEFTPARIDGSLTAEIRYDCGQLAHDLTAAADGPAKAEKTDAEEFSQATGPSLKNTILQKMKELPPTLQTIVKAKELIASQDADFEALQRVLETDQSLVAMVLKIANSSYYGMSGKISSLKHSITLLGFKTLAQVITLAATGNFLNQALKGYGFTAQDVRSHSLAVGFGSRKLAAMVNPAAEEDAFIAGLLHDAGKIMLNPYVAEGQICPTEDNREEITDLEKRVLGWDHGEIAAAVFTQWMFPAAVVDAIRFHHTPERSDGNELAYILYASDTLAKIKQDDIPIYEIGSVLNENVSDFLGIEQEDIAAIFIEMKESEKSIA